MISVLLVLGAAAAIAWPWISEKVKTFDWKQIDGRHIGAALLAGAALLTYVNQDSAAPIPVPPDPSAFSLRGKFVGPDASSDAAQAASYFNELASEMEWDSQQADPILKTGVAFDELRRRARLLLCRGVSLGDKHPRAREAIKDFLDTAAGTSGGPLTPEQRSKWVAAFREVGRAAADASR